MLLLLKKTEALTANELILHRKLLEKDPFNGKKADLKKLQEACYNLCNKDMEARV